LVHGTEEANKAQESAKALFAGGSNSENMPKTVLGEDNYTEGAIDILTLLVTAKMTTSKAEARRAVEQGGVSVNGEKVNDVKAVFEKAAFDGEFILKKGKKNFQRITNK
jgi:tyrosyl-tRNA synthetase